MNYFILITCFHVAYSPNSVLLNNGKLMEKLLRILQKQYYLIYVLLQIQSGQDYEKIAKRI